MFCMKILKPDFNFDGVTEIDNKLFRGKELIIFDIDNTLFFPETTKVKPSIQKWFKATNKKYPCICFSNSFTIGKRKGKIVSLLGCDLHMSKYRKPSKKLFKEITEKYKVNPEKVLVIGDFVLSDVLFGNRSNATTVLVRPMSNEEKLPIRLSRGFEKVLLFLLG